MVVYFSGIKFSLISRDIFPIPAFSYCSILGVAVGLCLSSSLALLQLLLVVYLCYNHHPRGNLTKKLYSNLIKITQRTWGHAKLHFREAGSKIQALGNFTESKIEFLPQRRGGGRRGW